MTHWGLCDVGGCGNSAAGPEVAIRHDSGLFLQVSLCERCAADLAPFVRSESEDDPDTSPIPPEA